MRCKPEKPALHERPLLSPEQAAGLMTIFKVLANDTRLRLLHALAPAVGMKPQAVSNQLQKLVDRCILACRRDGLRIRYRILDQCITALLDQGLCLTECASERQSVHAVDLA